MIDVIIPCYNAELTLSRAVESALMQPELGVLWLVDDGSCDGTLSLAQKLAYQYPDKIKLEVMPQNGGAAKARNWAALQSQAEIIAFLDADDAYEPQALQVAQTVFINRPETSLVRLNLKPINLAEKYRLHAHFKQAWQAMRMTGAGNMVIRRSFFLACGGFPQQDLFRQFGGEDGAFGIATTKVSNVVTMFEDVGVLNYCRDGMHAERLLDAILFKKYSAEITLERIEEAEAITENICNQIQSLQKVLNAEAGITALKIE